MGENTEPAPAQLSNSCTAQGLPSESRADGRTGGGMDGQAEGRTDSRGSLRLSRARTLPRETPLRRPHPGGHPRDHRAPGRDWEGAGAGCSFLLPLTPPGMGATNRWNARRSSHRGKHPHRAQPSWNQGRERGKDGKGRKEALTAAQPESRRREHSRTEQKNSGTVSSRWYP